MMMRTYVVRYWVYDDHDELEFQSEHRAGSKGNREDALRTIRRRKGAFIAKRAEIYNITRGNLWD